LLSVIERRPTPPLPGPEPYVQPMAPLVPVQAPPGDTAQQESISQVFGRKPIPQPAQPAEQTRQAVKSNLDAVAGLHDLLEWARHASFVSFAVPKKGGAARLEAYFDAETLLAFNMLGDVMCATLHNNTLVKKDRVVAGTRAIPLVIKRKTVSDAVAAAASAGAPVIEVKKLRKPRAGVVITGNEVYHGRIKDAFAPVIRKKIEEFGGEITSLYYAPDDKAVIRDRLEQLLAMGADLLITTGGMSVDPDDVTRFAIRELGDMNTSYGSPVLPGAMFLIAYRVGRNGSSQEIPVLGIPACGMYHGVTVFDIVLPRVLAGEKIGRRELAELGHGGLCLHCKECRYPVCPFGK
ncbi:MAG: molybdopterin-binding protein, partial [Nitrospiraceae bacterium]|nr:molybdopterin-binding protein [Nitrospiraceae bacterium]